MENLYDVLKITPNVGQTMIQQAYFSLLGKSTDSEIINKLTDAFSILGDPSKREAYDEKLLKAELERVQREKEVSRKREEEEIKEKVINEERIRQEQERAQEELRQLEEERINEIATYKQQATKTLQDVLIPFIGEWIGINLINPTKMERFRLIGAQEQFFSLGLENSNLTHIPYCQVLKIIEAGEGAIIKDGIFFGIEAPVFVEIFHMVVYKGSVSFGVGAIGLVEN